MDHQHRTMIAAIRHGKLDAKLQSLLTGRQTGPLTAPGHAGASAVPPPAAQAAQAAQVAAAVVDTGTIARPPSPPPPLPTPAAHPLPPLPPAPARERTLDQVILEYLTNEADQEQLVLLVEEEEDLELGRKAKLVIRARSSKSGKPVDGTQIAVRMISTVAEPAVLAHGRTDDDGLLAMTFDIPAIGRGTAALIITAASAIGRAELKHLL
ncbi:MAG: hypothetical protein ABUT39_16520 [Acidobacteriota bacterium]